MSSEKQIEIQTELSRSLFITPSAFCALVYFLRLNGGDWIASTFRFKTELDLRENGKLEGLRIASAIGETYTIQPHCYESCPNRLFRSLIWVPEIHQHQLPMLLHP